MSVGVMKDQNLKLRDLHASHTLGCAGESEGQTGKETDPEDKVQE
jgi:hypothetical protein